LKTWAPTFSGLGSIPFIVHPIDDFVDFVMDNTTRKWFEGYT
jgi:fission process protein 1